jgi:hypothetical protein
MGRGGGESVPPHPEGFAKIRAYGLFRPAATQR